MQKEQLDRWLHGRHEEAYQPPKLFIIGCADMTDYLLAVEYKHQLEPIQEGDEPVHFESIEHVKAELERLGVEKAYLRLHNAYDERDDEQVIDYYDIELHVH